MLATLAHLFTPQSSNNYKAKTLHLSSLSVLMLLIMFAQLLLTVVGQAIPGVLGIATSITAEELISLTNKQRISEGLPELKTNSVLAEAARRKAADMIAKNYWAHTSPEGKTPWSFFKGVNYRYLYAGENLARDFMDPESVVNAWMSSATHKDNILSQRYREIGIAVVHDTFQGQPTTLVVQLFGTPLSSALEPVSKIPQQAEAVLAELAPEENVAAVQEVEAKNPLPFFSYFHLTKAVSISLTLLLLTIMIVDMVIITKKKIVRLSGKGLAHLLFLGILLLTLLVIQPGLVL